MSRERTGAKVTLEHSNRTYLGMEAAGGKASEIAAKRVNRTQLLTSLSETKTRRVVCGTKRIAVLVMIAIARPLLSLSQHSSGSSEGSGKNPYIVVIASDAQYEPCAVKLLADIREHWGGGVVWVTDKSYSPSPYILQLYGVANIHARAYDKGLGRLLVPQKWRGGTSAYNRFSIFLDVFFRQFEAAIYLDVDGRLHGSLMPIFDALDRSNATLLMRDNGIGFGKGSIMQEYTFPPPNMRDSNVSGATCFFAVNLTKLPKVDDMEDAFYHAANVLMNTTNYADQGVLNYIFRHSFSAMAPCSPVKVVHPDNDEVKTGWYSRHCHNTVEIYQHDFKKACLHTLTA